MFATFPKEVSPLNLHNLTLHTDWHMLEGDDWYFVIRFLNALDPDSPPETPPELPQDGEDSVPGTPPSDDGIAVGSSPADYYDYSSGSSQEQQESQEWQRTVTEDEYLQEEELTENEDVHTASLLTSERPKSDYTVSPSRSEEPPTSDKSRPTQDSTHNTLPEPKGKGKQADVQPDFEHKDDQVDSQPDFEHEDNQVDSLPLPDIKGKGKHADYLPLPDTKGKGKHADYLPLPDTKGKGKHADYLPLPDTKGKGKHADYLPLPDIEDKGKHVDSQPDLKRRDKRVVDQPDIKGKSKKVEAQVEYLGVRTSPRVSKEPHRRAARSLTPKLLQDPEVECQGVRKSPQADQEPLGKVAESETAESSKDADNAYTGLRRSARLIKEPRQRVARSVAAEHLHRAEIKYLGARASPQVKKESTHGGPTTTKLLGVRTSPQVKKESSPKATGSAAAKNLKDAVKRAQGKVSHVQGDRRVSNRNGKKKRNDQRKSPARKRELERDTVSMEKRHRQHGDVQNQVRHGDTCVVRFTTGGGRTPKRKSNSNKPRKILTQGSLAMSEEAPTTSVYFDPVNSSEVISQLSCDDQHQGWREDKSAASLKSGHSKYSLEQRKIKRARRQSAHIKEHSVLGSENEPMSRSTLLPEPLKSGLQDSVQQTDLDLSQATSAGPRSHSSELSVEAMFEDLLGKDEVIRNTVAHQTDDFDNQALYYPAVEPVMFNAEDQAQAQAQAYYFSDPTPMESQVFSHYVPPYLSMEPTDQYVVRAQDDDWAQPQYTSYYPTVVPYRDSQDFDQHREYIDENDDVDEREILVVSPGGHEVDVLQRTSSGSAPQVLFEWRPHRLY
ncbi:hypothetical protein BGX34_008673 [Mortierella sp. NVP85]|nr:hypothetical protein BGX34_008673 [Mortierella sp. NVP85]